MRRAYRAQLGDGHLEVGEHFEQEGLELLVGPVELVDQQHRRARGVRLQRLQQRALDEEAIGKNVAGNPLAVGCAFGLRQPDGDHLRRVVPFVHGGSDVEALVTLQPDQARVERARERLCRLRLADAGLALEQQRLAEANGEVEGGREPAIRQVVGLAKGALELVEELAAPIPIRVLARILGIPDDVLPRLIELGDKLLVDTEPEYVGEHAFGGEREEDRYKPFGSPWAEELCALGRAYYADRRACPRDDVLTVIANAEVDGRPLTARELDNTFALMVVAGNETTRQAIALGTLAFAEHPDEYAKLRANPDLATSAVEELLRFSSPVWFFRRTATRDATLRGVDIAAGDKVVVWFAAANRDPDHYPDPHRLDLARDPADNLTFGRGGPHFCLGAHLAKLELRVYVEEVVARVGRFELAGAPQRLRSNFSNGLKRLPIRVEPA